MLKKEIPIRSHSGEFRKSKKANKKYLAEDFKHRCAYCDDLDSIGGGYKTYHVEHFAPKEKFPGLIYTYENLLYSCPYCNCSKNDDWPSNDPNISIVNNTGYIDPCNAEYYKHLNRDEKDGRIIHKTDLGNYMYNHMQLYLLRHSLIYMIDKLKEKIDELQASIDTDKLSGKNTAKKEELLHSIEKDFFSYYTRFQIEQST